MTRQEHDDAQTLRECIRALVRRFSLAERADVECCGVTVAQAATLEALHRDQGALRRGELGRMLGISPSTLTRNLARLEERGLVERADDPHDRRASRVRLTAAGQVAAEEVERQEQELAATVLRNLPDADPGPVLHALQDLLRAIRIATESCCPGAFDHLMAEVPISCCNRPDARPNQGSSTCSPTGGTDDCQGPTR